MAPCPCCCHCLAGHTKTFSSEQSFWLPQVPQRERQTSVLPHNQSFTSSFNILLIYPMAETENRQKEKKHFAEQKGPCRLYCIWLLCFRLFVIIHKNTKYAFSKKSQLMGSIGTSTISHLHCLRLEDLKKYIDGILTYSATNEGNTNWMLDAELVCTWVLFLHWSQFSNLPDKLERTLYEMLTTI